MFNGGYQIIDASAITVTAEQATVVTDRKIANILRTTNKPIVVFENLKINETRLTACACARSDTGAHDGRTYLIVADVVIAITTDDDTVTFTPT